MDIRIHHLRYALHRQMGRGSVMSIYEYRQDTEFTSAGIYLKPVDGQPVHTSPSFLFEIVAPNTPMRPYTQLDGGQPMSAPYPMAAPLLVAIVVPFPAVYLSRQICARIAVGASERNPPRLRLTSVTPCCRVLFFLPH